MREGKRGEGEGKGGEGEMIGKGIGDGREGRPSLRVRMEGMIIKSVSY